VVVADGVEATSGLADELRRHVRSRLSPHKYPRDVRFVEELPKTASGKLDRKALRASALAAAESGATFQQTANARG
jgi:acetyl-CoA synthetase